MGIEIDATNEDNDEYLERPNVISQETIKIKLKYIFNANKIPRRIPSNDAWTINIGALKIRKSIKFQNL